MAGRHITPIPVLAARYERYASDPENQTSIAAQIARRLWAGEAVKSQEAAEQYGCSDSMPGVVVRELRRIGYRIASERGQGNVVTYRVTGKGEPLSDGPPPRRRATFSRPTKVSELAPKTAPTHSSYPLLGASLEVKALALRDDGVVMQLVDGNGGAWQVTITGHVG